MKKQISLILLLLSSVVSAESVSEYISRIAKEKTQKNSQEVNATNLLAELSRNCTRLEAELASFKHETDRNIRAATALAAGNPEEAERILKNK